jgi:hypothetical protein
LTAILKESRLQLQRAHHADILDAKSHYFSDASSVVATLHYTCNFEVISNVMHQFAENPCVQRSACAAIFRNLCVPLERAQQDNAGRSGCIQSVVLAMMQHEDDSNIARIAMGTLARLMVHNRSNARRLVKFGGLDGIVRIINMHTSNARVALKACITLVSVIKHNIGHADIAQQAGAGIALIATLVHLNTSVRPYKSDTFLVTGWAFLALRNVIDYGQNVDNVSFVTNAGAVQVAVSILLKFVEDPGVVAHALCLLAEMGTESVELSVESGAILAVIEAMNKHASDAWIQTLGCFALKNMMDASSEQCTAIGFMGGVNIVYAILRQHHANNSLVSLANNILTRIK